MKYSDTQRLQKIYEYATRLRDCIKEKNITKESLLNDYSMQWLVTTPLYNIGEHVYYLSSEFKNQHPDIEWNLIAGLRHRLVHDYDGTNWSLISDVVFEEIPALIKKIKNLV